MAIKSQLVLLDVFYIKIGPLMENFASLKIHCPNKKVKVNLIKTELNAFWLRGLSF